MLPSRSSPLPALSVRLAVASLPWKPILQRLPGLFILSILLFSILAPIHAPFLFVLYFFFLHAMFLANVVRTAYGSYVAYTHSKAHSLTDWYAKYCRETGAINGSDTTHDLPFDQIHHIIIIPNYKEDLDTLCETLDSLASHRRAISQYRVCLAMEESELDSSQKAQHLLLAYSDSFFELTYTIHPLGRPGEIRGKSSNVAWATSQMALRGGARHDHEILTVMDADTGFAEDYFTALSYHYAVASPEQRRIMMFAPSTVFDRNAKNVPSFVRVTDMYWSIGVLANLYPSSPVKIPCSAYSVSMDLAISVGFWDAGAEAIGEDMHMYLKCFFSTNGHVIVKSIFSPASQCNIEGSGTGIRGYISNLYARYEQGKRHLWGTLDFGYSARRMLLSFIAPELHHTVPLKNLNVTKYGKDDDPPTTIDIHVLITFIHRLLECHMLMGHFLSIVIFSNIFIPSQNSWSSPITNFIWTALAPSSSASPSAIPNVHPILPLALKIAFFIRILCVIPSTITFYYYEKYHQWVGFDRWNLQDRSEGMLCGRRYDSATDLSFLIPAGVLPGYDQPKVQYLGRRPVLASPRIYPWAILDWIATPFSGVMFFVIPMYVAQLSHLFTDRLDYKVAAKPILNRPLSMVSTVSDTLTIINSSSHSSVPDSPSAVSHTNTDHESSSQIPSPKSTMTKNDSAVSIHPSHDDIVSVPMSPPFIPYKHHAASPITTPTISITPKHMSDTMSPIPTTSFHGPKHSSNTTTLNHTGTAVDVTVVTARVFGDKQTAKHVTPFLSIPHLHSGIHLSTGKQDDMDTTIHDMEMDKMNMVSNVVTPVSMYGEYQHDMIRV